MLLSETCRFIDSPRPRTFAALMEMYEANYMRLRCLCPALDAMPDHAVSRVCGALDLHLEVLERCKFTTTLLLTYYFDDPAAGRRANPNLIVRIYHDAHQAEVLSRSCRREQDEVSVSRDATESALACKWKLNRFLYKWLGYCRHQGHRFHDLSAADLRIGSSATDPTPVD